MNTVVTFLLLILAVSCAMGQTQAPPHECNDTADCKPYAFCRHHIFGTTCDTFLKQPEAGSNAKNCSTTVAGSKITTIPKHQICEDEEAAERSLDAKFATSRCYPQLEFTCARSYFMPCTPNYNADGTIITGQEESCPENFTCNEHGYGSVAHSETVKLCVPKDPKTPNADQCKDSYDCGYSVAERAWSACKDGKCIRALEK